MRKMKLAVLFALAVILLAAVPVSAAKPEVIKWDYEDNSVWADALCGFPVGDHEVLTIRTTLYYDSKDKLVREEDLLQGVNIFYNWDNPGAELVAKTNVTIHVNFVTGEAYVTGVLGNLTLPGYGTVQMMAGRWDWVLYHTDFEGSHLAGKDSLRSPQDVEQFCSYLAGN